MKLKITVPGASGGRDFLEVIADDAWVAKHGNTDAAETTAIAIQHAELGLQTYRLALGTSRRLSHIRLTMSMPENAMALFNEEVVPLEAGLSCFICLCDENNVCVCRPC